MDQFGGQIVTWLLTQGWPGLIIILLLGFGVTLFRDLRAELKGCRTHIAELQQQRVEDAKGLALQVLEGLKTVEAGMHTLTEVVKDRREKG